MEDGNGFRRNPRVEAALIGGVFTCWLAVFIGLADHALLIHNDMI
ncbi:MAG: hypothetical protein ACM4D3_22220 [Candidatus Sericytochromatia bacterium]